MGWHLNWLPWAHAGLVHEISDAVSSQEQQLCHVQKTLFATVLPDLWLLQYCLSLLCNHPWSLETGWYYSCPTLAKPFADIDSLWPVVSFCVSFCSLHSKASIMRSKSITNLWLCTFSTVGVPGPCSPKTMSSWPNLQHHASVSSHRVGLKSNQNVIGSPHNSHVSIAPLGIASHIRSYVLIAPRVHSHVRLLMICLSSSLDTTF